MNELELTTASEAATTDGCPVPETSGPENNDATEQAGATNESADYHQMSGPQLLEALKAIIEENNMEANKEVAAIKQAFYSMINRVASERLLKFVEEGNDPQNFSNLPDPVEPEIKQLLADFREKRGAYLEKIEAQQKENLDRKNAVISEISSIAEDVDNINLHYPRFQELQQEFKAIGEVPPSEDTDTWKNFQSAVEKFYDLLKMNKELRDLDFKKNLAVKQDLLEKAIALESLEDPIEAFRKLQDLHAIWRQTGPVAKELREELWNSFKEASTIVNKRHQDHFAARKEEEAKNEADKTALCVKVESVDTSELKSFNDWDAKTKEIIELQKEYKELGYASRKANTALFSRFRKACDDFFAAKAEHFKKTKEEFRENLVKKTALCEKAEKLAEDALAKGALDAMRKLQEEWKTIGVVPRKQGDDIWKRFCAAGDAFHAARKEHFGARRDSENENLAAKQAIIEELEQIPSDSERKEVIGRIRELQDKWQAIGHVPFKVKESLYQAFRAQLDRLYNSFDNRENHKRMKRFEADVKKLDGDAKGMGRERERLQRAVESKQSEINTIQNNLGFFKFKAAENNPMLKDFERKIKKLQAEISEITQKLSLLDKKE